MPEKLLEIKNLSVEYRTDEARVFAVNDISLTLNRGETLGLVGETGAGKTTIALSIVRLLPERAGKITGGEIFYRGENLLEKSPGSMRFIRGSKISMIFQDPMTSLNPIITIGDQIKESLEVHNDEKKSAEDLEKRMNELLNLVGIQSRRRYEYPHQFSGGMKQRVGIAIALACEPELLIADEPTTALDVTIQAQILELMRRLKEKLGTAMIMITHDLGVVAQTCDRVAVIYAGEIVESGSARDLFAGESHHPYTEGLFGSIPDLESSRKRLTPIEGLMPDPTDLPSGCKFHTRCKRCMDVCETGKPFVYEKDGHRIACHLFAGRG